jgi:predicted O-methyltransferase YrrM
MPEIPVVHPDLEAYMDALRPIADEVVDEMERFALEHKFPIIGPEVGHFLFALARFSGAKRVLELGSGYGYSAVWFARGMGEGGHVDCTDGDLDNRQRALEYHQRAGLSERVTFHVGDALEIAAGLTGPYDIVFNDIDKQGYPDSIAVAKRLLRPGGLFMTDNALWYGHVLDTEPEHDSTRGVIEFNRRMAADPDFDRVIVPIRDGVHLAVKL